MTAQIFKVFFQNDLSGRLKGVFKPHVKVLQEALAYIPWGGEYVNPTQGGTIVGPSKINIEKTPW